MASGFCDGTGKLAKYENCLIFVMPASCVSLRSGLKGFTSLNSSGSSFVSIEPHIEDVETIFPTLDQLFRFDLAKIFYILRR